MANYEEPSLLAIYLVQGKLCLLFTLTYASCFRCRLLQVHWSSFYIHTFVGLWVYVHGYSGTIYVVWKGGWGQCVKKTGNPIKTVIKPK